LLVGSGLSGLEIFQHRRAFLGEGFFDGADVLVPAGREAVTVFGRAHDDRPQEDHEIGFLFLHRAVLEQPSEQGNAPQEGNGLGRFLVVVLDQSAQRDGAAVVDDDGGFERALVGDQVLCRRGRGCHARCLFEDLHLDAAAFGDLRFYFQRQADVLAFHGLKRIDGARRGGGLREAAGHERDVLSDDDLGLGVIEREQVGHGQDVGDVFRFQGARQRSQAAHGRPVRKGDLLADVSQGQPPGRGEGRGVGGHARDRGAGRGEVGQSAHGAAAGLGAAGPLEAELGRLVGGDFDDERLDVHLGAAHVEFFDHGAQVVEHRVRRADDQRIGGFVRLDRRGFGRGLGRRRARAARYRRRGGGACFTGQQAAENFRQLGGLRVAQVHHARVAPDFRRDVQLGDQRAQVVDGARVFGADQQAVGAQIGHDGHAVGLADRGLGGRNRARVLRYVGIQPHDDLGDVQRRGVLERDDREFRTALLVEGFDDAQQVTDVIRVIRDDQRIGGRVDRDLAGRRHQRPQQGDHLCGRAVLDRDHVRDGLLAGTRRAEGHLGALLGVAQRDQLDEAARGRHGGVALRFQ
jgi:hypothetical protein